MYRENARTDSEHRVGRLFVLSGPSGAGKGTLREHALADIPNLVYSISCTTRRPRPGELDGREYRFITHEQFTEWVKQGRFLEYAHVHDDMYGTLKDDVMRELEAGNNVLLEIDVQGALQVREKIPDALLVFVDIPSIQELERRLRDRHTESESALRVRLANAEKERSLRSEYDYIIVNDELEAACAELRKVITS
ncbi:MAG: guanylate kinase, partial [Synergistaceae bacterium]|nr:guanylate kinase [Synergistaceae bacterium]